jgi:hypothetical protein
VVTEEWVFAETVSKRPSGSELDELFVDLVRSRGEILADHQQ